jgi:hypothetical protein
MALVLFKMMLKSLLSRVKEFYRLTGYSALAKMPRGQAHRSMSGNAPNPPHWMLNFSYFTVPVPPIISCQQSVTGFIREPLQSRHHHGYEFNLADCGWF